MSMNRQRGDMKTAVAYLQGLRFSKGGQLPFELFDAIALSEEEARELQYEVNSKRAVAEAIAAARRAGG